MRGGKVTFGESGGIGKGTGADPFGEYGTIVSFIDVNGVSM